MQADMSNHPLFKEAEQLAAAWLRPGSGQPTTVGQLMSNRDGTSAVGTASVCEALEGTPSTRIALIDLKSGDLEILTEGPRSDHSPQWRPDGRGIAYLSDREQAHINRLRILDLDGRVDRPTPEVNGFVEALQWSADGQGILLGVAGYGSDLAGAQGAFSVDLDGAGARPAWAPVVEGAPEAAPWRSAWLYDLAADAVRQISPEGINIWQAVWCGPDHIAVLCSDQPEESWWYSADVRLIEIATGDVRPLFKPDDQLGWLAAAPSGGTVAIVEAVCSDRTIVAGDVRLIDVASGTITRPPTLAADVVQLIWRGDDQLMFVAAQGPDTLIGLLDRQSGDCRKLWTGTARTPSGPMFPEIAPLGERPDQALFLCESFFEAPTLLALEEGRERTVRRFGTPETDAAIIGLGSARDFAWTAPDGLEIHGWLVTPPGDGPHPLIMHVHGGPVWYTRPLYLGRSAFFQMALAAGYALFLPNPRGSSGRGQAFARLFFGDMGGGDTHDYLSGIDALEQAGIADPERIGVTGGSYGGFISSWLITQDPRFAASVPVAPVTNWVSEHLTCHVPTFCEMFLSDRLSNPTGKYFTRSPIHFADRVRTPTLNICGALDKITPPGQALEFHHALQIAGVESVLVTYPQEGHGVRTMPAIFDYTARTLSWFSKHMPADRN